jgi:hypothetical protein
MSAPRDDVAQIGPTGESGMTINERLGASGLLDSFNAALASTDRKTMIELLVAVGMPIASAEKIADIELQYRK